MLLNERSFDKLFCDLYETRTLDLYFNDCFKDDPVFNHVVIKDSVLSSLENENEEQTTMLLDEIKKEARRRNFSPTIFVEDFWKKSQFIQNVAVEDDYFVGGFMEILSKAVKKMSETASKTTVQETKDFKLWNKTFMNSYSIPAHWEEELLRREQMFSTFNDTKLYIAKNPQNESVGCMLTHRAPLEYLGIYCVGTIPEMRHRGIASAMLSEAEQTAADIGCDYLTLQTITSDGVAPFYLKLGFVIEFRRVVLQSP